MGGIDPQAIYILDTLLCSTQSCHVPGVERVSPPTHNQGPAIWKQLARPNCSEWCLEYTPVLFSWSHTL